MTGRRQRERTSDAAAVSVSDDENRLHAIADRLTPWFEVNARELAWRNTRDPYAIWVSEVMLQQTRVETVQHYYDAFLARFPSVAALAAADEHAVLEAWSGLGYYRRARLLHRGARYVNDACAGHVPRGRAALLQVPGIGRYTAGAISAIAHDEPEALVDGNVARVLSRLDAVESVREQAADAPAHWAKVAVMLGRGQPRVLAQALMELGATVCTPKSPRCDACPVATFCTAYARGRVAQIPAPKRRAPSPHDDLLALAIVWEGRLLLVRRPEQGLLAKMWCLPLVARERDAAAEVHTFVRALTRRKPRCVRCIPGEVKHVFTHRVWRLEAWHAELDGNTLPTLALEHTWIVAGERPRGGMPHATEKLLARVGF